MPLIRYVTEYCVTDLVVTDFHARVDQVLSLLPFSNAIQQQKTVFWYLN